MSRTELNPTYAGVCPYVCMLCFHGNRNRATFKTLHFSNLTMEPPVDLSVLSPKEMSALESMREIFKDVDYPEKHVPGYWFQLNDWTFLRYLRARGYNVKKAEAMLNETLEVRRKFLPHLIRSTDTEVVNIMKQNVWRFLKPGKDGSSIQLYFVKNFDAGDPALKDPDAVIRSTLFQSECALKELQRNGWKSERVNVIFDLEGFSLLRHANPYALKIIKAMLEVDDLHFPETLGKSIVFNSPAIFKGVWVIIRPWLDVATQARVVFASDKQALEELIDLENLIEKHGGVMKGDYPTYYEGWTEIVYE